MRGLLQTTLGTVGACIITAAALTIITALVAGYAGAMAYAAFMLASGCVAFSAIFFVTLVIGHMSGVLEATPKEGVPHVDQ